MRGGSCVGGGSGVTAGSEKQVCYCNKAYEEVKRRAVCRSHARLHDSQKGPEHELCGAPPTHTSLQPFPPLLSACILEPVISTISLCTCK